MIDAIKMPDDGFLFLFRDGAEGGPVFVRISKNGNMLWKNTLENGSQLNYAMARNTFNGKIYVASTNASTTNAIVCELDSLANFISAKSFSNIYSIKDIECASDGSIYCHGWINGPPTMSCLVKLTSTLSISWLRTLGGASTTSTGENNSLFICSNGDVLIDGSSYIARYSNAGVLQWAKVISGIIPRSIFENNDGTILVGGAASPGTGLTLSKLSSTGSLLFSKKLTNSNFGSIGTEGIAIHSDGEIIIATNGNTINSSVSALLKVSNSSGSLLWAKSIIPSNIINSPFASVVEKLITSNESVFAIGWTDRTGWGNRDGYIVKMDVNGNSCCTEPIVFTSSNLGTVSNFVNTSTAPSVIVTAVTFSNSSENLYHLHSNCFD
jgi:hypothetical protein